MTARSVFLCLEVGSVWWPLLHWPTLSSISQSHGPLPPSFLSPFLVSLSLFLSSFVSLQDSAITCPGTNRVYPLNSTSKSLGILPSTWWHSSGGVQARLTTHASPQTPMQKKSLSTRHDTRHAAHSSLWQPCHNQHKSLSVSTRSKGIMEQEKGRWRRARERQTH